MGEGGGFRDWSFIIILKNIVLREGVIRRTPTTSAFSGHGGKREREGSKANACTHQEEEDDDAEQNQRLG